MELASDPPLSFNRIVVQPEKPPRLKVYKKRFWILFLFSFSSMLCGMMFPEYVTVGNTTRCFYGVSHQAVIWTTLIYMLVYIVLVFPLSCIVKYIDFYWTVLCGMVFNTAACVTQFFTLSPNNFNNVMVSMLFASFSNLLMLGIPPALAARWFPSKEVSRACAVGVFGNQLGIAIGFILGPLMVSTDCSNKDEIADGKYKVASVLTALNIVILILLIFTFQSSPKTPPSVAEIEKLKASSEMKANHLFTILGMFKNVNFILLFVLYGLMVGSYFAISTVLNNLILKFYPKSETATGFMGLLLIAMGLMGSIIAGYILDYTHRFQETSLGICISTLIANVVFSCLLYVDKIWVQFVTISIYGFFLTSFLPIGFEYGIEITYPVSENICASLLNSATMIGGIFLTYLTSYLINEKDPLYSNITLIVNYVICCILANFMTKEYKRCQKRAKEENKLEDNNYTKDNAHDIVFVSLNEKHKLPCDLNMIAANDSKA